jgi:hypothetical protein
MAEPDSEVSRLRQELDIIEASFWKEYADLAMGWQFILGPLKVRRHVSNMFIAQVFVLFHLLCFTAGAALIFTTGPTRELGIAMVVGSIFAFGSFVAQFWAVSTERGREIRQEVMGNQDTTRMRQLAERRREIASRIEQLERSHGSNQPSA